MGASYKIIIPKPCHENWETMLPNAKGRFCGQCQKTVVDFTSMPGAEISSYLLANADKKVCRRFNQDQLQPQPFIPQIPRSVLFSQTSFRKMFLLALFVTMGTTLFSCRDRTMGEPALVDDTKQYAPVIDTVKHNGNTIMMGKLENSDSLIKLGKVPPLPPPEKYNPPH